MVEWSRFAPLVAEHFGLRETALEERNLHGFEAAKSLYLRSSETFIAPEERNLYSSGGAKSL